MSQARSGGYLYRIPRWRKSIAWPWLLAAVVLSVTTTHTLAFVIGHVSGFEQGALQPPRVVTRSVTPLMQFSCSSSERREYVEACKRRAQSTLTFPSATP